MPPAGFQFDVAAHCDQLRSLLSELDLQPAALFAHSMGAIVATRFAETTPSVKAVVLAAPAGRMASPLPGFRTLQRLFHCCGGCGIGLVQAIMGGPAPLGDWVYEVGDEAAANLERWDQAWDAAHRSTVGNRALAASVIRMPLVSHELGTALRERGVAVLLLTAEKDPMVRGVDLEFYASKLGLSNVTIDPPTAGGHCFFLQVASVHPRIAEFLTSKIKAQTP